MLILASRSPRRHNLLRATGIEFRIAAPLVEDTAPRRLRGSYAALVKRSALEKAQSVDARGNIVLGADTIVVCDGEVLGKPRDERDARRTLRMLAGRWHRVYTGVALVSTGAPPAREMRRLVDYECTEVAFRALSKREIDRYVETGEPMDKAGAYAIQGEGAGLIRTLRGCYTNVIGLPLPRLIEMLAEFGAERYG
jgi:septum formation protein